MRDILLDTHIWIWISIEQYENLSKKAKEAVKQAKRKWISCPFTSPYISGQENTKV